MLRPHEFRKWKETTTNVLVLQNSRILTSLPVYFEIRDPPAESACKIQLFARAPKCFFDEKKAENKRNFKVQMGRGRRNTEILSAAIRYLLLTGSKRNLFVNWLGLR
jgi:hypothetical protein